METSFMAVNAINEDVLPVASSLQIDVDMTTDTQDEAALSSPPAIFHHPNEGDVNIKGGGSLMGAAQLLPKILKPVLDPQITGTYAEGDPFLAKLQEIDRDLQKFDHVPYEKKECARNQQSAQLSQIEGCQIGELGSLGFETDEYLKCTDSEITKVSNGPEGKGKIGLGPGPQKDMKKGQWTRITKRLNYDLGVEVSYGADGLKRKDRENQALNTLLEKKKNLKEAKESATKGGSVDFFLQLKAEVAELLRVEEKMWQQRSHEQWMISGDKNSSYFHNCASQRFRRNSITKLKDS
ncbi:hypothetical protein CFP56_009236 [Quercus suber]|uniref:Uncharacterized protein n=1 Tax=Quercus suber TaxID=58331 RepID=A0AAW0L533_QUESU